MTRRGRGSTRPGRPTALPTTTYTPPPSVREHSSGSLIIAFHGDDNRQANYDVRTLPLPG
jgi:hypothetical protein